MAVVAVATGTVAVTLAGEQGRTAAAAMLRPLAGAPTEGALGVELTEGGGEFRRTRGRKE